MRLRLGLRHRSLFAAMFILIAVTASQRASANTTGTRGGTGGGTGSGGGSTFNFNTDGQRDAARIASQDAARARAEAARLAAIEGQIQALNEQRAKAIREMERAQRGAMEAVPRFLAHVNRDFADKDQVREFTSRAATTPPTGTTPPPSGESAKVPSVEDALRRGARELPGFTLSGKQLTPLEEFSKEGANELLANFKALGKNVESITTPVKGLNAENFPDIDNFPADKDDSDFAAFRTSNGKINLGTAAKLWNLYPERLKVRAVVLAGENFQAAITPVTSPTETGRPGTTPPTGGPIRPLPGTGAQLIKPLDLFVRHLFAFMLIQSAWASPGAGLNTPSLADPGLFGRAMSTYLDARLARSLRREDFSNFFTIRERQIDDNFHRVRPTDAPPILPAENEQTFYRRAAHDLSKSANMVLPVINDHIAKLDRNIKTAEEKEREIAGLDKQIEDLQRQKANGGDNNNPSSGGSGTGSGTGTGDSGQGNGNGGNNGKGDRSPLADAKVPFPEGAPQPPDFSGLKIDEAQPVEGLGPRPPGETAERGAIPNFPFNVPEFGGVQRNPRAQQLNFAGKGGGLGQRVKNALLGNSSPGSPLGGGPGDFPGADGGPGQPPPGGSAAAMAKGGDAGDGGVFNLPQEGEPGRYPNNFVKTVDYGTGALDAGGGSSSSEESLAAKAGGLIPTGGSATVTLASQIAPAKGTRAAKKRVVGLMGWIGAFGEMCFNPRDAKSMGICGKERNWKAAAVASAAGPGAMAPGSELVASKETGVTGRAATSPGRAPASY